MIVPVLRQVQRLGPGMGWHGQAQVGAAGCCTITSQTCPAELPSASAHSCFDKTMNIYGWKTPEWQLSLYCVGAASTRVGHELGSGKPKQAQLAAATVIGLEVMLMVVVVVLGIALRDVWGYLFTSDPEVRSLATMLLVCLHVLLQCHVTTWHEDFLSMLLWCG